MRVEDCRLRSVRVNGLFDKCINDDVTICTCLTLGE